MLQRDRLWQEREVARAKELALEETTYRMDAFLATASHDVRAPLTTALGFNALAARAYDGLAATMLKSRPDLADHIERVRAQLQEACASGERLRRLVDLLFDTAKMRAGTLELRRAPCDLAVVVREQVKALRVAHHPHALRLKVPAKRPIPVVADIDRIGQVVTNYLTNAAKYSEAGRSVLVCVTTEGDWARVSVKDHGPGLAPSEQGRVWQPFYRVEGAGAPGRANDMSGLGMGLHICKTIIEGHGGSVGVDSTGGHGANFWFTLPRADVGG